MVVFNLVSIFQELDTRSRTKVLRFFIWNVFIFGTISLDQDFSLILDTSRDMYTISGWICIVLLQVQSGHLDLHHGRRVREEDRVHHFLVKPSQHLPDLILVQAARARGRGSHLRRSLAIITRLLILSSIIIAKKLLDLLRIKTS